MDYSVLKGNELLNHKLRINFQCVLQSERSGFEKVMHSMILTHVTFGERQERWRQQKEQWWPGLRGRKGWAGQDAGHYWLVKTLRICNTKWILTQTSDTGSCVNCNNCKESFNNCTLVQDVDSKDSYMCLKNTVQTLTLHFYTQN